MEKPSAAQGHEVQGHDRAIRRMPDGRVRTYAALTIVVQKSEARRDAIHRFRHVAREQRGERQRSLWKEEG
jgi:hypothetical protein